ncbi:MAG TPA: type II and III secretion system protein family protein [Sphingomicrobium sp.]|jgi:pilus assembly protein CpaC
MNMHAITRRARVGTAVAALAASVAAAGLAVPAAAQPKAYTSGAYRPSTQVLLSVGEGQMLNLSRSVASVWTSNPEVADVYVNGPRQMNLFGKKPGEATIIATAADGSVVYGANVRVNQNISAINEIVREAMPGSDVRVTTVGQVAILNGTVASPEDAAQAEMLVKAALNPGVNVNEPGAPLTMVPVSRLRVATPLQVTLKVRIAEINRTAVKRMGVNLLSSDPTGGFQFGVAQGGGIYLPAPGGDGKGAGDIIRTAIGSTFSASGKLFGLDLIGSLDIAAQDGLVSILAEPNLTALSGETASFLAGGEFPIPVSQSLGAVTIEYKQYGVGLAFTPVVLADGRISMRVRPEVSELSDAGSVKLNGYTVPALTTRRAETTVEVGSGQSIMIAGLLRNTANNSIQKAPFLGDLPVLGALFRSTNFQKQETELVVIVTPYLVRPVSGQLATPTDGLRVPNDAQRDLLGQTFMGKSGAVTPTAVQAAPAAPITGAVAAPGFKL